jgi:Acyl-protein synthetase, LuxE
MTALDQLLESEQYSLAPALKSALFLESLSDLTWHHQQHSSAFARSLEAMYPDLKIGTQFEHLEQVPFLPIGLFKSHRLSSIAPEEEFKSLTSSGTTGQQVSQVILDRLTAERQSLALVKIMTRVLGAQRLPMLVLDTKNVVKDRKSFSARGAGVLGMAQFGRQHFYALNDDMSLDREGLEDFLKRFSNGPILLFGFTFMVWKYFFQEVRDLGLDLSEGILIHSGGWKKLEEEKVSNEVFKATLRELTGLKRVHNFYGMVEQVGSVFVEGEDGLLYPPNFADVIVRDPITWEPAPHGQPGVIEVLSALPTSYPGHAILTEDLGVIHHEVSEGPWRGKAFSVLGRVPTAELRGCSDTHAFDSGRAA